MSRPGLARGLALLGFLAVWEVAAETGLVSPIILASVSDTVAVLFSDGAKFLAALGLTVAEIGVGIGIAWTLGVGVGLVAGGMPRLGAATGPLLSSLFAVPLIILYPLFTAWVGIGPASKVLFGVVSGFFPIALNTLSGVRSVDPAYAVMARAMGAGPLQIYVRVVLFLALPSIVSGLRVGTGLVVIGVVVTEMLASFGGVGFLISYHRTMFDTGHVYLGITLALMTVLAVNRALTLLERRFGVWWRLQAAA